MPERNYDKGIRIGMIFVVLVTSGTGVFAPLILTKLPVGNTLLGNILTVVKQFGTGIIISTAFIHVSWKSLLSRTVRGADFTMKAVLSRPTVSQQRLYQLAGLL
jgi:hypothetical protein